MTIGNQEFSNHSLSFKPPSQPSPTGEGAENNASRFGGTGKGGLIVKMEVVDFLHCKKLANFNINFLLLIPGSHYFYFFLWKP
jgi:hypothetical protein